MLGIGRTRALTPPILNRENCLAGPSLNHPPLGLSHAPPSIGKNRTTPRLNVRLVVRTWSEEIWEVAVRFSMAGKYSLIDLINFTALFISFGPLCSDGKQSKVINQMYFFDNINSCPHSFEHSCNRES